MGSTLPLALPLNFAARVGVPLTQMVALLVDNFEVFKRAMTTGQTETPVRPRECGTPSDSLSSHAGDEINLAYFGASSPNR